MNSIAFGVLTAAMLIISGCCLYCKKPILGFLSSIAAMVLTCLTGYSWKLMLTDSGKDTALLGFSRYPAAPVILCILFLLAAAGMILSIIAVRFSNIR